MSRTMRWSTGCLTCICTLALCAAPAWAQNAKGGPGGPGKGPGNKNLVETTGLKPTADETPKNPEPPAPSARTLHIALFDSDGGMVSGGTVAAMNIEGAWVKAADVRLNVHSVAGMGHKTTIMVDHPTMGHVSLNVNLPGARENWVEVIFDGRGNALARFADQSSAAAVGQPNQRGAPEGPSNCCIANGGVGCDCPSCEATVCAADAFCCDVSWDSICAGEAASLCGDLCVTGECPAGGCPPPAPPACGGPGTGDCFVAGGVPGCADCDCCATVCAADAFCCDTLWDSICAGEAATLCVGGGDCPPGGGDCCTASGGLGCNDPTCCGIVCAADPFCCDVAWDGICADEACAMCGDLCQPCGPQDCQPPCVGIPENEPDCGLPTDTVNGGCNSPVVGAGSNCCIANGGLGCDDDACEAIVCAADAFCCETAWDGICAAEAASLCGDLCAGGTTFPYWTDINCGETYCGTGAFDGATRDTDWYRITFTEPATVTWSVTAGFQSLIGLIEYLPGTEGSGNCADISGFINPAAFGNEPCVKASITTCISIPGTYFFFVAPQFTDIVACGAQGSGYEATLTCEFGVTVPPNDDCQDAIRLAVPASIEGTTACATVDPVPPPICGTSLDGPGVWYSVIGTGNTITATTCTDFFGFDTKLHVFCASVCGGGIAGASNCCFANGGLGCDDPACQGTVCAIDPFCCDVAWDAICAGEANSLCGVCGAVVSCVTGNDDDCATGADPFLSTVSWCSEPGCEYLILVSGFGGATGPFELVVTSDDQDCTPTVICCPPPTGACCFECGFCEILSQEACGIAGGEYQGDDTDCGVHSFVTEDCTSAFEDISGTGTLAPIASSTDDGGDADIPIGFTFSFFKEDHTSLAVCSNGYLTFGATFGAFVNEAIPDLDEPNDMICPLWDDWAPNQGGDVYYQTLGAAGSQRFIVQWNNVVHFDVGGTSTFQAVLYEGSNCTEYRYVSITGGASPTVGVENAAGSDGYPGGFGPAVGAGDCVSQCPEQSGNLCPPVAPQPQVWCTADPITPPQEAGCLLRLNWEIITPCLATENAYIDIGCAQIPVGQGALVLLNCDATYCAWNIVNGIITISSNYAVLHVEITDQVGQVRNCHLDLCNECPGEPEPCPPADPACNPNAGNCCVADGTPGCNDPCCCNSICADDPFCCDVTWDSICAASAAADPNCNCP